MSFMFHRAITFWPHLKRDETEARAYEAKTDKEITTNIEATGKFRGLDAEYTEKELVELAALSARFSYDYGFQTGLCLARKLPKSDKYTFLIRAHNKVVPFQTYAMVHGAAREKYFSPTNDLNHYDTVHAEIHLITQALKAKEDLKGTTLFINLMPCPACTRMFIETDIEEFVYSLDHSDGYALQMLEKAGKKVRRIVPEPAA
jgi:tRNA(Arg) A34 adenosine deaminase TadA